MNKGLWVARKNYLICTVRQLCELKGREDSDYVAKVISELLSIYADDRIEEAITCYEELLEQNKHLKADL
jgi:hypothetical protein